MTIYSSGSATPEEPERLSSSNGSPPPTAPPSVDWLAMFRADAGALVRNGHLLRGARMIGRVPIGYESALDPFYEDLRAQHYDREVELLRLTRSRPELLTGLGRASRAGSLAGLVTLFAFIYPLTIFAALPAVAARIVVTEAALWCYRRTTERLGADDRRNARVLFDVGIFSTRGP